MTPIQFSDYVGRQIVALIKPIDSVLLQEVTAMGVETGGIWVESQNLTNIILQKFGVPSAQRTLIFFFPFHEIVLAFVPIEKSSLNEKAFGL